MKQRFAKLHQREMPPESSEIKKKAGTFVPAF